MSDEPTTSGPGCSRGGLNSAEAAIVWAYGRFGGNARACEVLGDDAASTVAAAVESVMDAPDRRRSRLAERWRRQDRRWDSPDALAGQMSPAEVGRRASSMSKRWRHVLEQVRNESSSRRHAWQDNSVRTERAIVWLAVGWRREAVHLDRPELRRRRHFDWSRLIDMRPGDRNQLIRRLGVFQLAELARQQDRRSLVRLRRALMADDRDWFDDCIARPHSVDRLERRRLRELFVAVSQQQSDLNGRLVHLGVYSIAAAAGRRFGAKLRTVANQLPTNLRGLLLHYHATGATAVANIGPPFRQSLDVFTERSHEADVHQDRGAQP